MDITQLIELDKNILLKLNGSDSLFLDGFMWFATTTYIWIPCAAALIYALFKKSDWRVALVTIIAIALVILAADRISSGIFKPLFQRWRPAQDPQIMYLVDIVKGYRGGRFGFISSHAANTFALTTFVYLITKNRPMLFMLLSWAFLSSYSRVYLGVHYLGDITAGAMLGVLCAVVIYSIYSKVCVKQVDMPSNGTSVFYLTYSMTIFTIIILSLMLSNIF